MSSCCMLYDHFPDSSVGKESACDAGDPGLIPGSGRSAGEGIGYPLQYSWASFAAQLIKNLPVMQEAWVRSLDWEDPLEKRKATHSNILAWRIPLTPTTAHHFGLRPTMSILLSGLCFYPCWLQSLPNPNARLDHVTSLLRALQWFPSLSE